MEGLEKLEQVQRAIHLLHAVGVSDADPNADRFLADFTFFLMQPCGELDVTSKCQLITKHVSKILDLVVGDALKLQGEGCNQIGSFSQLHFEDKPNKDNLHGLPNDLAVVGIDSMIRSNSTLEDFPYDTNYNIYYLILIIVGLDISKHAINFANVTMVARLGSYFMFHNMEANQPQFIFRYLPILSFTESYIYQLDGLNEKLLQFPRGGAPASTIDFEDHEPNLCANSVRMFQKDPFRPLLSVLEHHRLLTERIKEELRYGEEYWALERKLCQELVRNKEISIEDVTRAIHLKSFDYRVLNLLLCQLRGEKVNDLHMEFLSISELLVEVSDDLFDYEDDVAENNFNVLRMFVKYYGASTAPIMMAKFISEAEEKYDRLFKALNPELSNKYQERCEEATKEGGKICGPSLGTWHIPPVIEDEPGYRTALASETP